MSAEPFGRDIFVRHTGVDGFSYVQQHRVWDVGLFMAAQERDAEKANADHTKQIGKPCTKAKAEQITNDQYLRERQGAKA